MKICLFNVKSNKRLCVNKDFMGGYGWAFNAGNSIPARMINFVKKKGENLPIMSLGYLAAIFSDRGHEVRYAEDTMPQFADIVIMQSSMVDHYNEMNWARKIKKAGKRIGFIGPFSGAMPELFLKDADFVIRGEPEEAAYRISDGFEPKGVVDSNFIDNLDSLPFPRWDLFPYKKYSYFPAIKESPFLPVLSSRGCPYKCDYCPYLVSYKWRARSTGNVLDEIGYLIKRYRIKSMLFRDPIFTLDRNRTFEIAEGMRSRGYRLKWACETRPDRLDRRLLKAMKEAGLRVINLGIESGCVDVIERASRKPVEPARQEEIIRYCDELGIRVTAFYMFGMPEDTMDSLHKTIDYAKALNTHVAQFFIFTPFPGTEHYAKVKNDIYEKDWGKFDCYTPVFRHRNLSKAEILELKEKAFVSYYYRPRWIAAFMQRAVRDLLDKI